ncbi:MAG: hypothetical protein U0M06_09600 [Clostridia bacterium]|nr:hypothetical protein [Clostridia bacterium]
MKHLYKRIIIIASYVILGIAVIALTGALILTIGSSAVLSNNLNSKNEELQSKLDSQKTLTEQYRAEAELWKNKLLNSDPDNVTYSDSFNSVKELNAAIKKNPTYYNNKRIKVVGTIYKDDDDNVIADDNGYDFSAFTHFDYRIWARREENSKGIISIEITDDLQNTVVETGDYVKMYGTVIISNGEIYLTDCEYSMIATRDER